MRSVWILVLVAAGCRGILGIEHPIDVDAMVDSALCATWHPQGFDPCALDAPMPALHLGAGQYLYDTTLDGGKLTDGAGQVVAQSRLTVMQPDNSAVAVLSVDGLAIDAGATVRVVGPKPLLVVAWSTALIDGVLDAGSHIGMTSLGANANILCGGGTAGIDGSNATQNGGSGGGGGGGLQGPGGHGGSGGAAPPVAGGAGGAARNVAEAHAAIHGGCPGGASGMAGGIAVSPATPATQARGGAGGGAVWLVAHDSIAIAGSISANGAGGSGAQIGSVCGGGGGGSGGSVALEAPSVTISGTLTANGGGGGGGGAVTDAGNNGADGKPDVVAAPGGAIAAKGCGRPGGAGSVLATLAGSDAPGADSCGGGGGGGGAGFLVIASPGFTATGTARVSPLAIVP
jgi:hypothetical protein